MDSAKETAGGLPALPDLPAIPQPDSIPDLPAPQEQAPDPFVSKADDKQAMDEVAGKSISERAVLMKVTMSSFTSHRKDKQESEAYGAGNVNKHLFRDSDRAKKVNKAFREVRDFVSASTLPWSDGTRVVPARNITEVMAKFGELRETALIAAQDMVDHWDEEVEGDMRRLEAIAATNGKDWLADPDDYLSQKQVQRRVKIGLDVTPIPDPDDFRVAVPDVARESVRNVVREAECAAAAHTMKQLAGPVNKAIERLSVPISDDRGKVFRDSLVGNIHETAARMRDANISVDPGVAAAIDSVERFADVLSSSMESLRHDQAWRDKAVDGLKELRKGIDSVSQRMTGDSGLPDASTETDTKEAA